jgi:hypothetical protein
MLTNQYPDIRIHLHGIAVQVLTWTTIRIITDNLKPILIGNIHRGHPYLQYHN